MKTTRWYLHRRKRVDLSASFRGAAIISLVLSIDPGILLAQAQNADSVAHALAFAIDSTDEGPHIYWQDNSTAFVIYMCDGQVLSKRGNASDSLRFKGLCDDSATRYSIATSPPAVEPHVFEDVSRVFTVSDLHGEYEALEDLLKKADVIDENLRWNWGDGHLVVLGDVFDRGDKVTECLWLIHRLEQEAKLAGGRVHYLLGNHEKMVIRGDLRYVHEKYTSGIAQRTRITYDDFFGPDMELGRWLRSKHVAVKLNDVLYVHAGLPSEVVERDLSLDDMNSAARSSLDLESYELVFSDLPWFLFSSAGPLWYRGYHATRSSQAQVTSEELDTILDYYGVAAIVVGHSELAEVTSLYQGRVYAVDVPVEVLDGLQGLLWKDSEFFRVLGTAELESLGRP